MDQSPAIERKPVASSNVVAIGFEPATQTLAVEFRGGSVYHHHGVPQSVYDDFMSADSKGSFYAKNIRGRFSHKKV